MNGTNAPPPGATAPSEMTLHIRLRFSDRHGITFDPPQFELPVSSAAATAAGLPAPAALPAPMTPTSPPTVPGGAADAAAAATAAGARWREYDAPTHSRTNGYDTSAHSRTREYDAPASSRMEVDNYPAPPPRPREYDTSAQSRSRESDASAPARSNGFTALLPTPRLPWSPSTSTIGTHRQAMSPSLRPRDGHRDDAASARTDYSTPAHMDRQRDTDYTTRADSHRDTRTDHYHDSDYTTRADPLRDTHTDPRDTYTDHQRDTRAGHPRDTHDTPDLWRRFEHFAVAFPVPRAVPTRPRPRPTATGGRGGGGASRRSSHSRSRSRSRSRGRSRAPKGAGGAAAGTARRGHDAYDAQPNLVQVSNLPYKEPIDNLIDFVHDRAGQVESCRRMFRLVAVDPLQYSYAGYGGDDWRGGVVRPMSIHAGLVCFSTGLF
ncbi:hypothetical protein AMAG_20306 [Allomyces macrogynus ATCC 38327]|uniref:Uncharacterized protein n=1 Tax=Allomyces macrogynus (strain ATCC 38327) TaxID=578462 RepID=A0A0L0T7E1_ALLM3|nr:hypothetical protein AMAG_20306 [Allomyces macrogynus ATCC 38327]|eukprot:KNE70667.1 hypothetical protein AMAG_20306 [Allomyces macrogynus ATCC 38327]